MPFVEDRLTSYFSGADAAHQAQKAEDDRLGDKHLGDVDEFDGCYEECMNSVIELERWYEM